MSNGVAKELKDTYSFNFNKPFYCPLKELETLNLNPCFRTKPICNKRTRSNPRSREVLSTNKDRRGITGNAGGPCCTGDRTRSPILSGEVSLSIILATSFGAVIFVILIVFVLLESEATVQSMRKEYIRLSFVETPCLQPLHNVQYSVLNALF